jgi:hypothetical protein
VLRLQKAFLIILLVLIGFVPLFLFRELPIGTDSMYYLGLACHTTPSISTGVWENIVTLLPCNALFFKFLSLFFAIVCMLCLYQIANILFKNQSENLLIVLFALGLTFLLPFFYQTENDQAGMAIGLLATLLFFWNEENCSKPTYSLYLFTAFFVLGLSIFIWKATALLLVWWVFYHSFALIPLLFMLPYLQKEVFPNNNVFEQISFYGFYMVGASIFYFWNWKNKNIVYPFIIFFVLAIIQLNLWVFSALLAPFMVLQSYYSTKEQHKWLYFVGLAAFCVVLFNNVVNEYPNQYDLAATRAAISISNDLNVDWSNAWLTYYLGGKPNTNGYQTIDNNIFTKKGYVLTYFVLPNCKIVYCQYEPILCKEASIITKVLKLQKCI